MSWHADTAGLLDPARVPDSPQRRPRHRAITTQLSRRQGIALLVVVILLAGALTVAAAVVTPSKARSFDLAGGSIYLADDRAPVAVDLTDGDPTVRLLDAYAQVSASSDTDLKVVPLASSTLLYNSVTGEFNFVDTAGFVVKTKAGGIPLPPLAGLRSSTVIASGSSAYVIQAGTNQSAIYLVNQATVEAARGAGTQVRPRAYTHIATTTPAASGTAVSANGDLWAITGGASGHELQQFSVPENSDIGAQLATADFGSVPTVAALGAATLRDGDTAVGLATATGVTVYTPARNARGSSARTVELDGLGATDAMLAAGGDQDTLTYLYHSAAGWWLVQVPTGQGSANVQRLSGVDTTADLVTPVTSSGELFTMNRGSGALWQINLNDAEAKPLNGAASYPIAADSSGHALEAADFSDATVITKQNRVIINSPNHQQAVFVYADGSNRTQLIDKSAAVDLNAAGGAAAIAAAHTTPPSTTQAPRVHSDVPTPTPAPAQQPIDNQAQCATTNQTPHIPAITSTAASSRSVTLAWTYPLLDTQDCTPSTYTVAVSQLSGAGAQPGGPVTVQGQTGYTITGLYPDSRYQVIVTAFLNGRSTASSPVQFSTGPEGPATPTGVHASTDSSGNWIVSWTGCGTVTNGCMPAASWTITPYFCDGNGVSAPPDPITISGDETLTQFSAQYPGTTGLLGRGLSFQVAGTSDDGTVGGTGSDSSCSYSWSTPTASAFTLTASQPPTASVGGVTTTSVALAVSTDQVQASGGIGATYTYQLLQGSTVLATQAPSSALSAAFTGLVPGNQYQARVLITPPRHPEAAITVGPVAVAVAASAWPAITATATFDSGTSHSSGVLSVALSGISSANSQGETFTLVGAKLVCGSTTQNLTATGMDPAAALTFTVNRAQLYGACTVGPFQLSETTGSYYGRVASGSIAQMTVTIPAPLYGGSANDFTAAFTADGTGVKVSYVGTDPASTLYTGLTYSVLHSGTTCGSLTATTLAPSVTVPLTGGATCQGSTGSWQLQVTYTFLTAAESASAAVTGTPPSPTPTPAPSQAPTPSPT